MVNTLLARFGLSNVTVEHEGTSGRVVDGLSDCGGAMDATVFGPKAIGRIKEQSGMRSSGIAQAGNVGAEAQELGHQHGEEVVDGGGRHHVKLTSAGRCKYNRKHPTHALGNGNFDPLPLNELDDINSVAELLTSPICEDLNPRSNLVTRPSKWLAMSSVTQISYPSSWR